MLSLTYLHIENKQDPARAVQVSQIAHAKQPRSHCFLDSKLYITSSTPPVLHPRHLLYSTFFKVQDLAEHRLSVKQ